MRRVLTLAMLLLPLAGCYVPPGGDGYGYAQPYGYQPDAYAGYDYNGGSPYMSYEGAEMPLISYGGNWGFYDRERRFHRAPDSVGRNLESRHPQGAEASPYGGRAPASGFGGGYQQAPPQPQYRQNTAAPAFTAPPMPTAPPAVRTAAPPAPAAPAPRREERHERTCPQGQTHC